MLYSHEKSHHLDKYVAVTNCGIISAFCNQHKSIPRVLKIAIAIPANEQLFLASITIAVKACWHQPGWHFKKLWLSLVICQTHQNWNAANNAQTHSQSLEACMPE